MREKRFDIYDDHGDGTYRWTVRENGDCDGCIDLVYVHEGHPEATQEFLSLDASVAQEIAVSVIELLEFFETRREGKS